MSYTAKIKNNNNSIMSFWFPWFVTLTIFENYGVKRSFSRPMLPGMVYGRQSSSTNTDPLPGEISAKVTNIHVISLEFIL